MRSGVAAILLAAGAGSRFGGGKLLAKLNDISLGEHVLVALEASPVDEVVVVVGADAERVREACEPFGVRIVENAEWIEGQSTSVRVGLRALGPRVRAAVVLLADQPLVGAGAVRLWLPGPVLLRLVVALAAGAIVGVGALHAADRGFLREVWGLVSRRRPQGAGEATRSGDTP
jgi:molybdopterin-guanine dinucleotide biosynthesis protein A